MSADCWCEICRPNEHLGEDETPLVLVARVGARPSEKDEVKRVPEEKEETVTALALN